ncbi:tetraacyldisaccharide 4'-kinase [Polaribacter sp. MSW13]|uniref:Tetraacyldisaccharide 4'-kinase n=1 Tax=Polaribacter marinus TaxID=2916838 RepID=A0A9X2AM97_9FLAO|nr:tetraacyldisaccharide 4'-kinase [Polaribacter marinus]MCI2230145.1 tetraacyldisaccharide 4'-kinase [Polaribacter marinus]
MKFLRFLLFPFAIVYDLITSIRNLFFDVGIFKQTEFKIPVIVVGNLSVGGTGKTPQIEYLIRLLKGKFKVAVLSRGYKRKTDGFVLVNKNHFAEDVGDEPLQYFKKFSNINIAVDANRVEGVTRLLKEKSPEVVLLDDAFQHRNIKGSFYVLLTKYDDLFSDDFLLPTGNLRESKRGAKRADIIVVTKCPIDFDMHLQEKITLQLKKYHKEIFFTTISYANQLSGNHNITINDLKEYEILLVTGIANPKPLTEFLAQKGICYDHLKFSDHHHFSESEIKNIEQKFAKIKADKKLILTTEKDFTRLENKIKDLSFLEIETAFLENKNQLFNTIIESHIIENQR